MRSTIPVLVLASLAGLSSCTETTDDEPIVVMTFNTGTNADMSHDEPPEDGYTTVQAELSDTYYGNGLAWMPLVEDAREFFAEHRPHIVAFQEIFYTGDCEDIPAEARRGFICEDYQAGDPTIATIVLGSDYQVACHDGYADKCIAVRKDFGTIAGCGGDLCLDHLDGARIEGCGRGSRLGRANIELASGGTLHVVNVHGASGFEADDKACRVQQFEKVFSDFGDGQPAARADFNLVLGDFNTDPARMVDGDESARRLAELVGENKPFHFLTEVGFDATPSYAGFFNIDHIISDTMSGECWSAGSSPERPPVSEILFFDHQPIVCEIDASQVAVAP